MFSVAVTTLDSLEKVAAPWRNAANTHQDEEEELESQPAAPEPEELPGKHISGVAVNFCNVWVRKDPNTVQLMPVLIL